jgi:hypothetical protein
VKILIRMVFVGLLALAASGSNLCAQQAQRRLTFKAPFTFQLEKTQLPAGEYTVLVQNGWLQIQGRDGKSNVNVLTLPVVRKAANTWKAEIVFHQYQGHYFLAQIWTDESGKGRSVLESNEEQQIAKEQKQSSIRLPLREQAAK